MVEEYSGEEAKETVSVEMVSGGGLLEVVILVVDMNLVGFFVCTNHGPTVVVLVVVIMSSSSVVVGIKSNVVVSSGVVDILVVKGW